MASVDQGAPLIAHLSELRRRLIYSLVAAAVGFALSYNYSLELYDILTRPLIQGMPEGADKYLVFTGIVEPFFIYMKVGFVGSVLFASPVILFQAWCFIAPALHKKEKVWFVALVFSSFVLFIVGVVFSYLVVFPFGFKYLLGYTSEQLRPMLSMTEYFNLVTKLLLAFGLIFQLPLAMLVLSRMGVVTGRKFLSWWRYAIIVIMIVAAVLTPTPDVFNQMLMAGPLIVLYGLGVVISIIFGKRKTDESKR